MSEKEHYRIEPRYTEFQGEFPEGNLIPPTDKIVAMVKFNGRLFVATQKRVYELKEEKLKPIEMAK